MKLSDWKIHFNISYSDLPKAWKIISETLLYHKMYKSHHIKENINDIFFAMKAVNIKLNKNFPEHMSGREITIYIYKYNEKLNGNSNEVDDINEMNEEIKKKIIYTKADEEKYQFWFDFLIDVEKRLKEDNIQKRKNNGCADGDLYLGLYTSLRNESFTFNNIKKYINFHLMKKDGMETNKKFLFLKFKYIK